MSQREATDRLAKGIGLVAPGQFVPRVIGDDHHGYRLGKTSTDSTPQPCGRIGFCMHALDYFGYPAHRGNGASMGHRNAGLIGLSGASRAGGKYPAQRHSRMLRSWPPTLRVGVNEWGLPKNGESKFQIGILTDRMIFSGELQQYRCSATRQAEEQHHPRKRKKRAGGFATDP